MIAQLKKIGIEPGKSFDLNKADPAIRKALGERSRGRAAIDDMEGTDARPRSERLVNEHQHNGRLWQLVFQARHRRSTRPRRKPSRGCRYILSIWPTKPASRSMERTNTRSTSTRATRRQSEAFWSITLYDAEGFQVANPLNRFAVSSWMPFKYNADGSLDLYFQNESPGTDKEANWLPAPKGAFNLLMRLYAPKSEALTGKWNPPPVTRVSLPSIGGQ